MAAVKCVCPECNLAFAAPESASGTITCPICDTNFAIPRSGAVRAAGVHGAAPLPTPLPPAVSPKESALQAAPAGRHPIAYVILIGGIIYLVGGAALGVYLLKGGKAPEQATAQLPGPVSASPANAGPAN